MHASYFKRTLTPQMVFLAAIPLINVLLPVRPGQVTGEDMGNALLRVLCFVLAGSVTWLVALVLTGRFLPGGEEPSAPPRPVPESAPWEPDLPPLAVGVLILLAIAALMALPFLLAWLGTALVSLWVIQFAAFLLYCIRLYNVFRSRLGPAVLEALERARAEEEGREVKRKTKAKVRVRQQRLTNKIASKEREIDKLRSSPLHDEDDEDDVVSDAILTLQAEVRDLRQELEILEEAQDTEGGVS